MLRWVFILLLSINSLYSQVQFQVPGITVSPSNTIDLPVTIQTNGNVLGSLEFALNYDQSILQFSEIVLSEKAQTWLTYTMDTGNGKVRWGGYDKTHGQYSITNPTELFILKFVVLNTNWTQTPITVGRKTAGDVQGWDIAVASTNGYVNVNRNATPLDEDGINGRAYPVPTNDIVTVDFTLPISGDYNITLYDTNGTILQRREQRFTKDKNSIQESLQSYSSGIYLLQIANTKFAKTFKIIKN
jgi:hypothetical protein